MAARRLLVVALAAALAGCYADMQAARPMPMPWGSSVVVDCQGGNSMTIEFIPAPRSARVRFGEQTVTLREVDTAGDAQFSDGTFTLFINDQRAALVETGIVRRGPCRPL
jgi:membrane-bound inhibitor of C-type lysozyme